MKSILALTFIALLSAGQIAQAQTGCLSGNCQNGLGTYKWDSGDKYTGEWRSGARTGVGVYDWSNGSFYYGNFLDGKLEGDGFYIGLDSSQDQIGVFHNGSLAQSKSYGTTGCLLGNCTDGTGVYLWESNDLYIGEWKSGARTGYGRYDWEDGSWYIGGFKDGKLDGTGEYHPKTGSNMIGTFVGGVFQGSTSSTPSTSTSSTPSASSYKSVNEASLCEVLKNVVGDFANNFENIKGKQDESDSDYDLGDTWDATWKLTGSTEAKISEPLVGDHNTWYNTIYEGSTYADARAHYDDFVNTIKTCGTNCCNMVYDTHDYKGDSYSSYSTYWLPLTVKDGYSDDFKNLEIEVELATQIFGDGWEVTMRVVSAK